MIVNAYLAWLLYGKNQTVLEKHLAQCLEYHQCQTSAKCYDFTIIISNLQKANRQKSKTSQQIN